MEQKISRSSGLRGTPHTVSHAIIELFDNYSIGKDIQIGVKLTSGKKNRGNNRKKVECNKKQISNSYYKI